MCVCDPIPESKLPHKERGMQQQTGLEACEASSSTQVWPAARRQLPAANEFLMEMKWTVCDKELDMQQKAFGTSVASRSATPLPDTLRECENHKQQEKFLESKLRVPKCRTCVFPGSLNDE